MIWRDLPSVGRSPDPGASRTDGRGRDRFASDLNFPPAIPVNLRQLAVIRLVGRTNPPHFGPAGVRRFIVIMPRASEEILETPHVVSHHYFDVKEQRHHRVAVHTQIQWDTSRQALTFPEEARRHHKSHKLLAQWVCNSCPWLSIARPTKNEQFQNGGDDCPHGPPNYAAAQKFHFSVRRLNFGLTKAADSCGSRIWSLGWVKKQFHFNLGGVN